MSYLKWDLKQWFTNPKNSVIYIVFLLVTLFYALRIAPSYAPVERIDPAEIEARYNDSVAFIERIESNTDATYMQALSNLPQVKKQSIIDRKRLDALAAKDYRSYAVATAEWYNTNTMGPYKPEYYTGGNIFSDKEGFFAYIQTAKRYEGYTNLDMTITPEILEERTALQTLQRLLSSGLLVFLLLIVLVLSADTVLRDRTHKTVLGGFPLTSLKQLFAKGITILIGATTLWVLMIPALLIIGFQQGFGSLAFKLMAYSYGPSGFGVYDTISLGRFFTYIALYWLSWLFLLILLSFVISLVFKSEFLILLSGILLFASRTYFINGTVLKPIYAYSPLSYVDPANIITGATNYLVSTDLLSAWKGLVVISLTNLLLLFVVWLLTRRTKPLVMQFR